MKYKLDFPGSIISRKMKSGNEYWYYKSVLHDTWQSSKLSATKSNWNIVADIIKRDYLISQGLLNEDEIIQDDVSIFVAFENYLKHLTVKQKSTNTIDTYKRAFNTIIKEDFNITKEVTTKNKRKKYYVELLIEEFVDNYITEYSNTTINIRINNFRPFLSWCYKEKEYFDTEIRATKYLLPKTFKDIIPYTDKECLKLFRSAYKIEPEFCYWLAIMRLNGLRRKESIELEWADIDFENRTLKIENKIKKTVIELLPFSDLTFKIFKKLKEISIKRNTKWKRNKVFRVDLSSSRDWRAHFREICLQNDCYIRGRAFHGFRKAFITELDNMNLTFTEFKTLARLKDYNTAEKHYIKKDREKLRKIMNDLNSK